ncbi:hypothetical protein MKX03_004348 [Papaver bracteatum]|nr:hypothetical protein MKX03_004348 [Papaver bracteatum]
MEAGTPGDYYINPSKKLMSKASDWKAVEHEDHVETRTNMAAFDTNNSVFMKRYNNQAVDGHIQNEDEYFSYIVNSDFLNLKEMRGEVKDGIAICYYPKIKVVEKKKNVDEVQA